MRGRKIAVVQGAAAVLVCAAGALARPGPDVTVCDLTGPTKWGTIGSVTSYSIGTRSYNAGTANLNWIDGSSNHPVIPQNIYRLKDGRFEQLGMSWLKHSFCALQEGQCGTCPPLGGCLSYLQPGCSDPYTSARNGDQNRLGPRNEVNAFTGVFPWPHGLRNVTGNALFKRIQVNNDDLNPTLNPGAYYFGEAEYVARDDATWGNGTNNASYRRILVGALSGGGYTLSFTGNTARTSPAIQAWKDFGGPGGTPDPDVTITNVDVPGEGRYVAGYKVTDLGGGTWHYEFAIQNINSDISGGSFEIPLQPGTVITNAGFHDVNYHSGEPYDNTDWTNTVTSTSIRWASPQTFAQNPNSNALRWATLYNFRFDANAAPTTGNATLGLFKPAEEQSVAFSSRVPGTPPPVACPCDHQDDGTLNSQDFFDFLGDFFANLPAADFNIDGSVNSQDFFDFLACFFAPPAGC
jgi:hypothetical protein